MKVKLLILAGLIFVTACSLFSSPQGTVKKFMAAAKKGDVSTMTSLFSQRAVQRDGLERLKENNQSFADMSQKANERSAYSMNNLTESRDGVNARVGFHYQSADRSDMIRMVFALTKEGGQWKIDNIGGAELEGISDLTSPELKDPPKKEPEPVETAPALPSSDTPPVAPSAHAPISGGVLNGKAISLPKPPYPPIAKAAKASGTVVVQVLVDENGDVISAHAISGHPLLQAACVAAARAAKFSPTKLSGQPVKVSGVLNYNFEPPAN